MKSLDWQFARTLLGGVFLGIVACGGESKSLSVSDQINDAPNDVMAQIARKAVNPQIAASVDNFLLNGSFEADKTGWTDCELGKPITIVNDAQDGANALEVDDGNCFYQSIEITPGADLRLSCYAKVVDDFQSTGQSSGQWTGMGLGFSDSKWTTLSESPPAVVTSSDYTRYDVRGTAPENTKHVSLWLYSETRSLVDNCVLTLAESVVAPPISTDANFLLNPRFEQFTNGMPKNWVNYCNGTATASSIGGHSELVLDEGACVSQGLSASTLSAMQGQTVELSCDYEFTSTRYAEVVINLDGKDRVQKIDQNSTGEVDLIFTAPESLTTGFVSIYSEGEKDTLKVDECVLQLGDSTETIPAAEQIASIDVSNGLEGPDDRWTLNAPYDYVIRVTNTGTQTLSNVSITSDNIEDCLINYTTLVAGEVKTEICTNITPSPLTFSHVVTATATSPSGEIVSDSDQSSNDPGRISAAKKHIVVVIPSSYGTENGGDITFTVEAGNNGNTTESDIHSITSNVSDCNREFSPPITIGEFQSYTCTASGISPPFNTEFTSIGPVVNGTAFTRTKSVNILPAVTNPIDISYDRTFYEGLNRFALVVENKSAVNMLDVKVSSDILANCSAEFPILRAQSKLYTDCQVTLPARHNGDLIRSNTVATGTTWNGVAVSDSVTINAFLDSDIDDNGDVVPVSHDQTASIDVSNGLEGWDYWYQGAPFDYTITVTNTGFQTLSDVSVSSNKIPGCKIDWIRLDAGETRNYICTNAIVSNDVFAHTVTATALDEYGQTVTDSDVSRNRNHGALVEQTINAVPSSYDANNGDTITFAVEAANNGNSEYSDIHTITSNIDDCSREFDPPITNGTFKRYTCVANEITTPFTAEFLTTYRSGNNGEGTGWKTKSVEIQPTGTTGIDIRYANGGSGLVSVTYGGVKRMIVENTGSVALSNVLVRNQSFPCDIDIATLQPREQHYMDCAIPTLSGPAGEIVRSDTVVTATTADGSIISDSEPLIVFNREEINLDVEFGTNSEVQYNTPGEVKTVNLSLTNSGVLSLNELETIEVITSDIFTGDTSDCQAKFTALTQQPNFSLAPGQSVNTTCDLTMPTNPGTSYSATYIQILVRYRAELLPELLELTQHTTRSKFIE